MTLKSTLLIVFFAWLLFVLVGCAGTPPRYDIEVNETPELTDDYVTWAPTVSRIHRVPGSRKPRTVNVTLESSGPVGRVRFADYQDPWPANSTATATSIQLTCRKTATGFDSSLPAIQSTRA